MTTERSINEADQRSQVLLKAIVLGGRPQESAALPGGEPGDTLFASTGALVPPYDPEALCMLMEHSNSLRQNIDAYAVNIDGFGHRFEPTLDFESEDIDERVAGILYVYFKAFGEALAAAGQHLRGIDNAVRPLFQQAAPEVVRAARAHARSTPRLTISADFNAVDKRIIRHLQTSEANYVRDEYGRRHQSFSEKARQIVAQGLEEGLGRTDIAQDLERAAQSGIAGRDSYYWEVVAGSFIGRGRSFGQMSSFAEAGIERYKVSAVLDQRTSNLCRFLDGKTFSVRRGLEIFDQVEADPGNIREHNPWLHEAGGSIFIERSGQRIPIAQVVRSGVGIRDDRGEYINARSEQELEGLNLGFPPFHASCRSTCSVLIGE